MRSILSGLGVILGFLICLFGLILTAYGTILVLSPPFGPAILVLGLAVLASGVGLLRMLLRQG
jgi:hypothetical protein